MRRHRRAGRERRGQVLILTALVMVVVILSIIGMVSQSVNLRASLVYEPYEEITEDLSLSFRSAMASALANMTRYLNGSTDPRAVDKGRLAVYNYLTKWKEAVIRAYAGIGLEVEFTTPLSSSEGYVLQGLRNMSFQTGPSQYYYDYIPAWNLYNLTQVHWDQSMGCSAVYATLSVNISEYGFYGWKKDIIVAANATIFPDSFVVEKRRLPADIVLVLDASGSMFYNHLPTDPYYPDRYSSDKNDHTAHIAGTIGPSGWTTVGIFNAGDIPMEFHAALTWTGTGSLGFQMKNGSLKPQLEVTVRNGTGSYVIPIQSVADAYVRASQPDSNYGGMGSLQVQSDQNGDVYRTWLRFDLSSIPLGSIIDDAVLTVYVTGQSYGEGRMYYVHHSVDDVWSEGDITWSNQPAHDSGFYETIAPDKGWMSWDITPYVKQDFATDMKTSWVIKDRDEAVWPISTIVMNSKEADVNDQPGFNVLRSYKYGAENRRDVWSYDDPTKPPQYLEPTFARDNPPFSGNIQGSSFGSANMWKYGRNGEWMLQLNNNGTESVSYTIDIYTRKLDQVRNAATMFLKLLNPAVDRLALVEFGPNSIYDSQFEYYYIAQTISRAPDGGPFYNLSSLSQLNDALMDINWRQGWNLILPEYHTIGYGFNLWPGHFYDYGVWGGGTPLGAGIERGANAFNSTYGARLDSKRIMIIITDGKENIRPSGPSPGGEYYEPYIPGKDYHHYYSIDSDLTGDAYRDSGVITYTIGYGEDADAYALNILAQNGHGNYYYAANGSQLAAILAGLAYQLNDELSFHFKLNQELESPINTLAGSQLTIYLLDSYGNRHKADLSRFNYRGGGDFVVTLSLAGWQTPEAMEMVVEDPRGILVRLYLPLQAWRTQGG